MRGVFGSPAVLQPAGHGGASEGRSYLLAGAAVDTADAREEPRGYGQEVPGRFGNFKKRRKK